MKCRNSSGNCKLELKFFENGNVVEFCTVCSFTFLHESKNIENNQLNPHKENK